MPKSLRQNDRGGDDRTGQRAAPRLIDASDAGDADGAQFAFMPETTAAIHRQKIIHRLRRFSQIILAEKKSSL